MRRIYSLHVRDIAAPMATLGEIIDTLGAADDRLWAKDIWVGEPVEFDRPLGIGASGGHGSIRYSVEQYEPGRRILFRFTPGTGLSGVHGFELQPLKPDRTRLTHFLDAQASLWMRPFLPILIPWHDAIVETAFDRAELEATGSLRRRTPIPRWLRVVNRLEIAVMRALGTLPPATVSLQRQTSLVDRLVRPAAVLVPAALGAIAAVHAAWALGWRWPGHSDDTLADRVVGAGAKLPPDLVMWAMAALVGGAATVVGAVGAGRRERLLRAATWSLAAILFARGALSIPMDLLGGLRSQFARLDLAIYSPLCLALGAGAAIVARGVRSPKPAMERYPENLPHPRESRKQLERQIEAL